MASVVGDGQEATEVGVLSVCSLREKGGAGRKLWAPQRPMPFNVEGACGRGGRGGLEWCPGGAVGQERPDPGGNGQAVRARVAGAEQGRPCHQHLGLGATVPGGGGDLIQNLNSN
jgi:hypothetical protein